MPRAHAQRLTPALAHNGDHKGQSRKMGRSFLHVRRRASTVLQSCLKKILLQKTDCEAIIVAAPTNLPRTTCA